MTKPIITVHNVETNEVINREMTNAEFAQYKKDQAESEARQQADEAKAAAKAAAEAKLAALGLTVEDLQALGLGGN